ESNGLYNYSEKISETLNGIGLLSLIDKPAGILIELKSEQIKLTQIRELTEKVKGTNAYIEDSQISIPETVFDHIDEKQKEQFGTVDIRLLMWKQNPHERNTKENITSS